MTMQPNDYVRQVMATRCTPTDLLLAEVGRIRPWFWFERDDGTVNFVNDTRGPVEFKTAYSAMVAFGTTAEENARAPRRSSIKAMTVFSCRFQKSRRSHACGRLIRAFSRTSY